VAVTTLTIDLSRWALYVQRYCGSTVSHGALTAVRSESSASAPSLGVYTGVKYADHRLKTHDIPVRPPPTTCWPTRMTSCLSFRVSPARIAPARRNTMVSSRNKSSKSTAVSLRRLANGEENQRYVGYLSPARCSTNARSKHCPECSKCLYTSFNADHLPLSLMAG
jgi:hypothetical protein